MRTTNRAQDQIGIAAGLWLMAAPWLLGYSEPFAVPAITATVTGALVFLLSVHDCFFANPVDEWLNVLLGTLLVVSPVLFGYVDLGRAALNAAVSGLVIMTLGLSALERLRAPTTPQTPDEHRRIAG